MSNEIQGDEKSLMRSSISSSVSSDITRSGSTQSLPTVLARYESSDCFFDLKVTQVESTTFHGTAAHQLQFKLDLARPFDPAKRIRSATVTIKVYEQREKSRRCPKIVGINPEASLVYIADHEITNGQTVGLSAGINTTAPAVVTASANRSWGDKTTFKGNRLIHGYLLAQNEAQWKMYEEPMSKSGLPPSMQLLMIVESKRSFTVRAQVSVIRWSGWTPFGVVRCISTSPIGKSRKQYNVKNAPSGDVGEPLKISDAFTAFLDDSKDRVEVLKNLVDQQFPNIKNLSRITHGRHAHADRNLGIAQMNKNIMDDIKSDFQAWRLMATSDAQRQGLDLLQAAVDRRLKFFQSDDIENTNLIELDPNEGGFFEAHDYADDDRVMYRTSRRTDTHRSSANTRGVRDVNAGERLLFGTRANSAEQALQNHRTVGRDWSEAKL